MTGDSQPLAVLSSNEHSVSTAEYGGLSSRPVDGRSLPPSTAADQEQPNRSEFSASLWTSPIPPAKELKELREFDPDLPNILIAMVKAEAAHRRAMERKRVELEEKDLEIVAQENLRQMELKQKT
ncbi:MAG: hypothetical protein HQL87_11010 [Magnetococcales bacterium]|nr:hypothetical protein [Magnetococcales bacterium]